ncbi:tail fiber assembly protein [Hafnia alvei]|uniref:tail fiber assembly protein n=1 Tax=Hafnia alvei TaxID=569 RepID=UPI0040463AF9
MEYTKPPSAGNIRAGGVPRDTTEKAPTSDFDLWDGAEWIKDTQAEKYFHIEAAVREHKGRINLATDRINTLQDAIGLEMATDFEVERLKAWRKYCVLLSRVDTSKAPDVDWSQEPSIA